MYAYELMHQILSILLNLTGILFFSTFFYMVYKKEKRKTAYLERRRYTYDFCSRINKNDLFDIELLKQSNVDAEIFYKPDEYINNPEILKVVDFLDTIAIGIKSGILDPEIVVAVFESYINETRKKFEFFIMRQREYKNNPDLFVAFEMLLKKWDRIAYEAKEAMANDSRRVMG